METANGLPPGSPSTVTGSKDDDMPLDNRVYEKAIERQQGLYEQPTVESHYQGIYQEAL